MGRRLTTESVVYWTSQVIVICSVFITICFSLKSSLESDKIYKRLRGDETLNHSTTPVRNVSCRYPLTKFKNECQPPCNWSFMTSSEMKIYDQVMSNCLKIAMISTVITFLTWLACKPLRKFPHIVRFYILLSSASFTFAGILPPKLNTIKMKPHCPDDEYWTSDGITSNTLILQGAICHYLLLNLCFWLLCYVVNTFLLLVLDKHYIFTNAKKIHVTQLLLSTIAPFIFVAICVLKKPGYHMMFKDRLAILPSSYILVFGTITLPVVVSAGVSLTMLVAVVRRIRKVSHNPTTADHVIRSDEERNSLKSVERHFIVIICLYALAMIIIFIAEVFLQDQEITYLENILKHFSCLQTNEVCNEPSRPKFFLSNMKILTPGFFCLITFFLLFLTNETRSVWAGWLNWICSQARNIGRSFLRLFTECKLSSTWKRPPLGGLDQVVPVSSAARLNQDSAISLKVTTSPDLSSCETKASTLVEDHHGKDNDIFITHL